MPAEIQSMLLRVLETKQIKPLGSNGLVKVDFRLICASNHEIRMLADPNKFRFDLFSRINALEIHIPPLRERRTDIPLLINYYLTTLSETMNIKSPMISKKALDRLCEYHYPGNIRELKNIVQRLLLFNKKDTIEVEDLIFTNDVVPLESMVFADFDLESNEKKLIIFALDKSNGVITNAAKILGISPFALARRLKKYKLSSRPVVTG
jgi:DNA-binding NtrC family response regulator